MNQGSTFSLGGIGMSGEASDLHLMARIMSIKISHAGGSGVEEDLVLRYLHCYVRGEAAQTRLKISDSVTLGIGEHSSSSPPPVVAEVGPHWKVFLHPSLHLDERGSSQGGTITTLLKDPLKKGNAWVQDPIFGSPAKTTISAGDSPELPNMEYFYVSRETHYSHGLVWDPNSEKAADMAFFDDGSIKWKRRYQGGKMMGRGDCIPAHESYWPAGILQAEEYGSVNHGRFRDPLIGPAYVEYHPNGQKALEVFAYWHEANPSSIVITGSGAWDSGGKPRTPDEQEARTLSDTGLEMARHDSTDEFFEARRMNRLVGEAVVETGATLPRGEVILFHPSGQRKTLHQPPRAGK